MAPFYPWNQVHLVGLCYSRAVTVAWPLHVVRGMLPWGLELGEQDVTEPGTHPVFFFFNDILRAHLTIPSLLPSLTYHEQIVGVPYTYVTRGAMRFTRSGPFFFMPQLNLDSLLATAGGLLWWGFAKRMARISVSRESDTRLRFSVADPNSGAPLISLDSEPTDEFAPFSQFEHFWPIQQMLNQPLVSQPVMGLGPFFACSDVEKRWEDARVRPLSTEMHIQRELVPGMLQGQFVQPHGIDEDVLGSFELNVAWRLSVIYPPELHG